MSEKKQANFSKNLLQWHATHHRPMPWKGEKNPYLVWLSEIILQQTRVEQGLPYFEKFKAAYPTVTDLSNAPEDEVMKLWEGLGYYSRARNLHAAAKYIAQELGGHFPSTYEGIRSLKGVGPYTAAAIASFAFDLPHAVVDGNVYRVLSRYFGIEEPIDTTVGKKLFAQLAQEILEGSGANPGDFNQAMMDFGAGHCTPAAPKCGECPMRANCVALQKKMVEKLPVKSKKLARRQRFFNYFIIHSAGKVFIKKRTGKDIWRGLYDFPLIETEALVEAFDFFGNEEKWQSWFSGKQVKLARVSQPRRQELTHQRIVARFWEVEVAAGFSPEKNWAAVEQQKLREHAFPKLIDQYFRDKFLTLDLL